MHKISFSFISIAFSLFAILVMTGCAHKMPEIPKHDEYVQGTPDGFPDLVLNPYRLQIGDVLGIKLFLNPELNDEVTVRPDGMISTSLVQDIKAYGLTPAELQKKLVESYRPILSDPRLTVIVRSFAPSRVYVLGEVTSPGELVFVGPNLTLLQAIARAGGVKNSAETKNILILHRGIADKAQAYSANYDTAVLGKTDSDTRLTPFDVVYVPRTGVADAYLYYQQHLQQFLPPSFGLSYQLNPNNN